MAELAGELGINGQVSSRAGAAVVKGTGMLSTGVTVAEAMVTGMVTVVRSPCQEGSW